MRAPMATRAMTSCSMLGFFHLRPFTVCNTWSHQPYTSIWTGNLSLRFSGGEQARLKHSLVDMVMEEFRSQRRIRASLNVGSIIANDISETNPDKKALRKGLLLEFENDSKQLALAIAHRPDGKKHWFVHDQNGHRFSIKPDQITYILPDIEISKYSDITTFEKKVQDLLDPSILEATWLEVLERGHWLTLEELSEIIYGTSNPLECYCTYLLLSRDKIYFESIQTKDSFVYEARPTDQVEELKKRKLLEKELKKEFDDFIETLILAKNLPQDSKPSSSSWLLNSKVRERIESLVALATENCKTIEQRQTAITILEATRTSMTIQGAQRLLMDIGYFPKHVNLALYNSNIKTNHNYKSLLAAEFVMARKYDPDESTRRDLTELKVYIIDVDNANELDDALSAERISPELIRVWIHIADPASIVEPLGTLDMEAMARATSLYLPTATYHMFPKELAMERMSLKQGVLCRAVTVSVVLNKDGRVMEYEVFNSTIKPTYELTYENANELIYHNAEEEEEINLLCQAASFRTLWRSKNGAIETTMPEPRVHVSNPDSPDPEISLTVPEGVYNPAMRMVMEMMLLCGDVIAKFGEENRIPLPYRGQPAPNISDYSSIQKLPAGPARSMAYIRNMRAVEFNCTGPVRHNTLGLDGYVQFTSPIRRYSDLLAHYQVKMFLRSKTFPFLPGALESRASVANARLKVAKKLQNESDRYWVLEYMRRQQDELKNYSALILFFKARLAVVLLVEVGIQAKCVVPNTYSAGDHISVRVVNVNPRRDILMIEPNRFK